MRPIVELSFYIRKMMSIERRIPNKGSLPWNPEWVGYQRKAAKLCSLEEASDAQKRLVFRHI
jgi:hypothetical protein